MSIQDAGGGLPALLIDDGKVVEENLTKLGYDTESLKNELHVLVKR